jgi:hypothetical protein
LVCLLGPWCRHLRSSSWNWLLVQSFGPVAVSPVSVKRSHFAVCRFLGFVVFRQRVSSDYCLASRSNPLFEFSLPLEYYPAKPSLLAVTNQLLSWAFVPFSTPRIGGPPDAGLPARYVPPSGFGYPLDGFLPSIPCRFCFTPAALMGFTLRSFLLPEGIRGIAPGRTHLPFNLAVFPPIRSPGRPDRHRFLGFGPSRSAWQPDEGLVRRLLATPMGFALLGFSGKSLDQDFARSPLTRFAD